MKQLCSLNVNLFWKMYINVFKNKQNGINKVHNPNNDKYKACNCFTLFLHYYISDKHLPILHYMESTLLQFMLVFNCFRKSINNRE